MTNTRCVLMLTILQLVIAVCSAANGIIWSKEEQKFIQLSNIPQFAVLEAENLVKRRKMENIRDMKGEVIKAAFYEEKNMIMFINNDTSITGICGDLWHLLANYLNFTLKPVKTRTQPIGVKLENGTSTGLISMLGTNEAQVILRSKFLSSDELDYTLPIWKSMYHVYVQPKFLYDNKWVFTLFSLTMWYCIIFLFIIMSFVGYFLQKIPKDRKTKRGRKQKSAGFADFSLNDHFFHSFGMMCSQGYIPDAFYDKFKILSFSKSIFAWLLILAFSSNLIYRMANRQLTLPFTDIDSLFNNTKYTLLAFRGSYFHSYLKDKYANDENILARIRFMDIPKDMYTEICKEPDKYAMVEIEDRYMALNKYGCPLLSIGDYNETWITSIVKKNVPYKKSIDIALIKFSEAGLLDFLRNRWLKDKVDGGIENEFKKIDLDQVYLIFLILCCGVLISFTIFILEKIIHCHETRNTSRRRK